MGRKWQLLLIAVILPLATLIAVASRFIIRQKIEARSREAISNLRSMGCALLEFDDTYGVFPNDTTAPLVKEKTDSKLRLGNRYSNDYFRQLIAAEITQSESMFFAAVPGAHKPDNDFGGEHALEKGEVGYAYIVGLSTESDPKAPLVVAPLVPGTNLFDPKPFGGRAVVLPVDASITRTGPFLPINEKGEVIDSSGKHILDPANPVWRGKPPRIVWPH